MTRNTGRKGYGSPTRKSAVTPSRKCPESRRPTIPEHAPGPKLQPDRLPLIAARFLRTAYTTRAQEAESNSGRVAKGKKNT
jgi:hypothetical protein